MGPDVTPVLTLEAAEYIRIAIFNLRQKTVVLPAIITYSCGNAWIGMKLLKNDCLADQ